MKVVTLLKGNGMKKDKKSVNMLNEKSIPSSDNNARRIFMKKIAYSTPKLIALGYLVRPTSGIAGDEVPSGPIGPPG